MTPDTSFPSDIARLYGYRETPQECLERELEAVKEARNWSEVAKIAARLEDWKEANLEGDRNDAEA